MPDEQSIPRAVDEGARQRPEEEDTLKAEGASGVKMQAPPDFENDVRDAQKLLRYATEAGKSLPDGTIPAIIHAQVALQEKDFLTEKTIVDFYSAYTVLASTTAPVTKETLGLSEQIAKRNLQWNAAFSVVLAIIVVLFSGVTFITSALEKEIGESINLANGLAVKLHDLVGPTQANPDECGQRLNSTSPVESDTKNGAETTAQKYGGETTAQLQQFAATERLILKSANKLNFFVRNWETSPLDIPKGEGKSTFGWDNPRQLLNLDPGLSNIPREIFCKISAYQEVRDFGQNVRGDSLAFYGALSAYLLPVLFAVLGALSFNLRDFSQRIVTRSYHPWSYVSVARTIAAMTVGAIISLFSTFGVGSALPPLAIAFLAGYGVEVFFAFLDALLVTFGSKKP